VVAPLEATGGKFVFRDVTQREMAGTINTFILIGCNLFGVQVDGSVSDNDTNG
jgi:hypothetical protein